MVNVNNLNEENDTVNDIFDEKQHSLRSRNQEGKALNIPQS